MSSGCCCGSGLEISPIGNVGLLEIIFQPLDGAVGVGVDGVVDLHLKNQVRAALEVEAEVNALLQRPPADLCR